MILLFDAALYFANANILADDVRAALERTSPTPSVVLIDAESVSDIDSTALIAMHDLRIELEEQDIELWAARVKTRVREAMERVDSLDLGRLYPRSGWP